MCVSVLVEPRVKAPCSAYETDAEAEIVIGQSTVLPFVFRVRGPLVAKKVHAFAPAVNVAVEDKVMLP